MKKPTFDITFHANCQPSAADIQVFGVVADDEVAAPSVARRMLLDQGDPLPALFRRLWTICCIDFDGY